LACSSTGEKGKMMIGYVDVAEQVDADFTRALRRAFVHRMGPRLRGNPSSSRVPTFEEAARTSGAHNRRRLGRRVVAVEEVVGSVGRSRDFDKDFLPIGRSTGERWKRVDRAFHQGVELSPVELYEPDGRYFVVDGNHRISVARFQGVRWIEAEVTRLYASTPTAGLAAARREAGRTAKNAQPAAA
jgi:hypothetical protein